MLKTCYNNTCVKKGILVDGDFVQGGIISGDFSFLGLFCPILF